MAQPQPQYQQQYIPWFEAEYPAPPPFWRLFTSENLAALEEAKSAPDYSPSSLPYDLKVLIPPPVPANTNAFYKVYGTESHIPPKPTLPDPDTQLLDFAALSKSGNQRDHARKLWHLSKSLMLNFLELSTVMGVGPSEWEEKLIDVDVLMKNINGVINTLRPHQGREALKALLERKLEEGREEMERCDALKGEIEEFLRSVGEEGKLDKNEDVEMEMAMNGIGVSGHVNGFVDEKERKKTEEPKRMWQILDEISDDDEG